MQVSELGSATAAVRGVAPAGAGQDSAGARVRAVSGHVLATVWGAAVVVAGVATTICYGASVGVNWGMWTTVAGAALLTFAGRGGRRVDPVARWSVLLAVLVSWGAGVTADAGFQGLIFVAAVTLLAVAVRVVGGVPGARVGAAQMMLAPPTAGGYTLIEAGRWSAESMAVLRGGRSVAAVRGVAIAVPVAAVFALLLAGADPVLAAWRDAVEEAIKRLDFLPQLMFFLGVGVLVLGGYGLAVRGRGAAGLSEAPPRAPAWQIGSTERRIVVGATASVFGLFLAVQPSYLFRHTEALRVSGVSYTEYVHRGFSELTIAATLCVALVLALNRYAPTAERGSDGWRPLWWRHWGTLLLIAEVLVVLVSAFYRVSMYEAAYGYTTLRVYVQAYVVGVGVTLVLLAAEVAGVGGGFDARRAARRSAVVAALFLAAFSFGNPERWVAEQNLARFRATGKLDGSYLVYNLSLNAAPVLVAALPTLPPTCSRVMRNELDGRWGGAVSAPGKPWYEWNLRRERGLAELRSVGIGMEHDRSAGSGWACNLGS